jgi:flagellar motor switch protein FliM
MRDLEEDENKNTGIKAFLDHALQSYEKLPMLEIVFEKFVRQLTTSMRYMTSEPLEMHVVDFNSSRFGNYFQTIKPRSSIVVFNALEWEHFGLLVFDSKMIFMFVDILLGGSVSGSVNKSLTQRVPTSIEQGITKQIVDLILVELSSAFEQISTATFVFERLETNPNFATIARPGDAVIVLKMKIIIDDNDCCFDLVIPYKTIDPIKDKMQQVFLGEKFGADLSWERGILNTMSEVDIDLEAVIINKPTSLSDVANLKVGDTIIMDHKQEQEILVRSGPIKLLFGQIGKVEDKVAINVTKIAEN